MKGGERQRERLKESEREKEGGGDERMKLQPRIITADDAV